MEGWLPSKLRIVFHFGVTLMQCPDDGAMGFAAIEHPIPVYPQQRQHGAALFTRHLGQLVIQDGLSIGTRAAARCPRFLTPA
jgi:hypothetical protein